MHAGQCPVAISCSGNIISKELKACHNSKLHYIHGICTEVFTGYKISTLITTGQSCALFIAHVCLIRLHLLVVESDLYRRCHKQ